MSENIWLSRLISKFILLTKRWYLYFFYTNNHITYGDNSAMDHSESDSQKGSEVTTITEVFSNPFLLYPCVAFASWDAITTGIGTIAILEGNGLFTYIGAALVTCFTTAMLFSSFKLFQIKNTEAIKAFIRILFGTVVLYDLYTSYYGAKFATFSGAKGVTEEVFYDMTFSKGFVVLMLTVLAVSATMICSWLYHEKKYGNPVV